ncbi:MAG: DUF721 domain-containing protein [Saprospiraceae bacterium]|nr:DUF721 domain-containing protein [Saprospiraceae bacterium]
MKKSNDQKLSEIIREFADQKPYKNKLFHKKVEVAWMELFGDLTKGYLEKLKIQNKILSVYLKSPSLRIELEMNKKLILSNINKKLAPDQLEDIKFR